MTLGLACCNGDLLSLAKSLYISVQTNGGITVFFFFLPTSVSWSNCISLFIFLQLHVTFYSLHLLWAPHKIWMNKMEGGREKRHEEIMKTLGKNVAEMIFPISNFQFPILVFEWLSPVKKLFVYKIFSLSLQKNVRNFKNTFSKLF